jgi:hypothetical protein
MNHPRYKQWRPATATGESLPYVQRVERCSSAINAVPGRDTIVTCDRSEGHEGDHYGVSREHSQRVELSWTTDHELERG